MSHSQTFYYQLSVLVADDAQLAAARPVSLHKTHGNVDYAGGQTSAVGLWSTPVDHDTWSYHSGFWPVDGKLLSVQFHAHQSTHQEVLLFAAYPSQLNLTAYGTMASLGAVDSGVPNSRVRASLMALAEPLDALVCTAKGEMENVTDMADVTPACFDRAAYPTCYQHEWKAGDPYTVRTATRLLLGPCLWVYWGSAGELWVYWGSAVSPRCVCVAARRLPSVCLSMRVPFAAALRCVHVHVAATTSKGSACACAPSPPLSARCHAIGAMPPRDGSTPKPKRPPCAIPPVQEVTLNGASNDCGVMPSTDPRWQHGPEGTIPQHSIWFIVYEATGVYEGSSYYTMLPTVTSAEQADYGGVYGKICSVPGSSCGQFEAAAGLEPEAMPKTGSSREGSSMGGVRRRGGFRRGGVRAVTTALEIGASALLPQPLPSVRDAEPAARNETERPKAAGPQHAMKLAARGAQQLMAEASSWAPAGGQSHDPADWWSQLATDRRLPTWLLESSPASLMVASWVPLLILTAVGVAVASGALVMMVGSGVSHAITSGSRFLKSKRSPRWV